MAFERISQYQNSAGTLSDAAWIADLESFAYLEGGLQITAADFPNGCPSGTVIHAVAGTAKPGPSTDGTQPTGLTRYPYNPLARGVGSSGTMSMVVGGVIHVDKLPVMPGANDLPASFIKQNDSGAAFGAAITPATDVVPPPAPPTGQ